MCTVFWGRQDILIVEFLFRVETINALRYCKTLRNIRPAIQNRRRRMLNEGIVMLHDSARLHSPGVTQDLIEKFS